MTDEQVALLVIIVGIFVVLWGFHLTRGPVDPDDDDWQ